MQIEVPDHLLTEMRERARALPDASLKQLAVLMMEVGLSAFEFRGEEREPPLVDQLTGCLTYGKLQRDLREALSQNEPDGLG